MSSSPVRGPVLRDLSPNCRPTKDGGGWLGDSDSIILSLNEDEAVPSENVSIAPSLDAEVMRSTSCVPRQPSTPRPHPRSPQHQTASVSAASVTPIKQRIMSGTPTSTPRLKTLAPIPSLRRVSTTPTTIKAPQPTTPSSASRKEDHVTRHARWEERRAEERRRREEETSVLAMLTSIDRGNEEYKARQSIKMEDSTNPPTTPLLESPSELGGESSMAYQRPSQLGAVAQSSPAPSKPPTLSPRGKTLSPQDRREVEEAEEEKNNDAAEEDDNDNNGAGNVSPIKDDNHPPVDICESTLRGHNENDDVEDATTSEANNIVPPPSSTITASEHQVTPTKTTTTTTSSSSPQTFYPAALSRSPQRVETRGPLVSPQRPARSLTPSEKMVAKAVSQSLSRQTLTSPVSMKGCSITVSPLSSKAVSPTTTTTTTTAVEEREVYAPVKIEVTTTMPTTPQTSAKPTCSSVASGTPLLFVSTATQMTPQLVVAPPQASEEEEVQPPQATTTLIKKEPSEEAAEEVVEKEGSTKSISHTVVVSENKKAASASASSSPLKRDKVLQLLPLGGSAAIGQKRSRDTSASLSVASYLSNKDYRSDSRTTSAQATPRQLSSHMASEPEEEEEQIIQPERKLSEKLKRIAAKKKAALSQSPVPKVIQKQQQATTTTKPQNAHQRKLQLAEEHRERLRQERRARAAQNKNGQKKKNKKK